MFNTNENRIGAFAGIVAFVLVLALTAMAFTALSPERTERRVDRDISMPDAKQAVAPSFVSRPN